MPPKDTTPSELNPHVKVTYLKRPRKTSEMSANNAASTSNSASTKSKATSSAMSKSEAVFKTPEKPIRIVDFRSDTSPRRTHADASNEGSQQTPSSAKRTLRHSRSSSSIVKGDHASSGPSPVIKPPSVASRVSRSTNRSQTPVSETNHDNASVADSIADSGSISSNRMKRTESERKLYFENQAECGVIEPRRAFCTRCREWVKLSGRQTYYVKPWEVHRVKCDQKLPVGDTYKDLGLVASVPFVVPRTEKNRKALLELDDTAETIEPNQIKCKTCQQWVPLEKKYSIRCWTKHEAACHNNLKPGDVEKTLERKLFFMCDEQFECFRDSHTAKCAACKKNVSLGSESEYDLDLWLEHKEVCRPPPDTAKLSSERDTKSAILSSSQSMTTTIPDTGNRQLQPQTQPRTPKVEPDLERKPLSTADSERTLVEPSSSSSSLPAPVVAAAPSTSAPSSSLSASLKRKRDPADEDATATDSANDVDMADVRPATRPRTMSYIPEDRDAPSALGWFLLPFKAFVKGFKESLTTLDS